MDDSMLHPECLLTYKTCVALPVFRWCVGAEQGQEAREGGAIRGGGGGGGKEGRRRRREGESRETVKIPGLVPDAELCQASTIQVLTYSYLAVG